MSSHFSNLIANKESSKCCFWVAIILLGWINTPDVASLQRKLLVPYHSTIKYHGGRTPVHHIREATRKINTRISWASTKCERALEVRMLGLWQEAIKWKGKVYPKFGFANLKVESGSSRLFCCTSWQQLITFLGSLPTATTILAERSAPSAPREAMSPDSLKMNKYSTKAVFYIFGENEEFHSWISILNKGFPSRII